MRPPIESMDVDYNKHPLRLLDWITFPISSNGWKVEDATFCISVNRIRNLLGLDLHEKLGLVKAK